MSARTVSKLVTNNRRSSHSLFDNVVGPEKKLNISSFVPSNLKQLNIESDSDKIFSSTFATTGRKDFNPPKIENKDEYFCIPDLDELQKIAKSSNPIIPKFVIGSRLYGKVTFTVPVKISEIEGLVFDKVISFTRFRFGVYVGQKAPPKGRGLNLPAIITFFKIGIPKKYSNNLKEYEKKLRIVAEKLGPHMSFHSYNESTKTLKLKAEYLVADT